MWRACFLFAMLAIGCGGSGGAPAPESSRDASDASPANGPGLDLAHADEASGPTTPVDSLSRVDEFTRTPHDSAPTPCLSGSQNCEGDHIVQCLAGEWVMVSPPCDFGCIAGQCNECRPGARACEHNAVKVCNADGRGWSTLTTCDFCLSNGECADGSCEGSSPFCADSASQVDCLDGYPQRERLCEFGCDEDLGECRVCVPASLRCRPLVWADGQWSGGYLLLRCNDDGLSYGDIVEGSCDDCWCSTAGDTVVCEERDEGRISFACGVCEASRESGYRVDGYDCSVPN